MLTQKLQDELTTAIKARNQERVETIRLMLSELKNARIEKGSDLEIEEEVKILKKEVKKLRDAVEMFQEGGRTDLVEQNKKQIEIIEEYLPAEMSDSELELAIQELKKKHKDVYENNSQALIGIAMKELSSQADPRRILDMLKED
jgi:uncharacterized protein